MAPQRLVDRLNAHHNQLMSKADYLVLRCALSHTIRIRCASNATGAPRLPAVLQCTRVSRAYADAAILRLCARPLVVPAALLLVYNFVWA
jgi:hypothetical protein